MQDELHAPVRAVIEEWAEGYANPNKNFIQDFQRRPIIKRPIIKGQS